MLETLRRAQRRSALYRPRSLVIPSWESPRPILYPRAFIPGRVRCVSRVVRSASFESKTRCTEFSSDAHGFRLSIEPLSDRVDFRSKANSSLGTRCFFVSATKAPKNDETWIRDGIRLAARSSFKLRFESNKRRPAPLLRNFAIPFLAQKGFSSCRLSDKFHRVLFAADRTAGTRKRSRSKNYAVEKTGVTKSCFSIETSEKTNRFIVSRHHGYREIGRDS